MTTIHYRFPNDPVIEAHVMFGAEFLEQQPNRRTTITTGDGDVIYDEPLGTEIVCDCCNATVLDVDPCAIAAQRLYCWPCAKEWILKHRVPSPPKEKPLTVFLAVRRLGEYGVPDFTSVSQDPAESLTRAEQRSELPPIIGVAQFDHVATIFI